MTGDLMLNLVLFAAAAIAAGQTSEPQAAAPPAAPTVAAPTVAAPTVAATPAATPISAEDMARDPRMIAAIRHANATADRKCGEGVGGNVDLATKAEAARCRRRMIATAKLDAESEISGH